MSYRIKINFLFLILTAFLFQSCKGGSDKLSNWQTIDWKTANNGSYADFTYQGLPPSCSDNPISTNSNFHFLYRKGSENNLVVFFQGGGACWHTNNCINDTTYTYETQFFENQSYFDMVSKGQYSSLGYGGIFDLSQNDNPFKNWSFIYIPYCTGDLFWGAKDTDYNGTTIRHRGHVNFRVVLEWMKDTFSTDPEKIFVTGISAGSYGAIINFPYIKEAFTESEFYVLSDSGVGVINSDFIEYGLPNWNSQLPTSSRLLSTPGFTGLDEVDLNTTSLAEVNAIIANYYADTKFAQYTTAWDSVQVYYLTVMENIDNISDWDDSTDEWCVWNQSMNDNIETTSTNSTQGNYKFFIAPGEDHTIMFSSELYSEVSNGTYLVDWINDMINGGAGFDDVNCTEDCNKPSGLPDCL
ncbi:pectin acetylesterase-family hydrolase [Spirochaetota bacterium]